MSAPSECTQTVSQLDSVSAAGVSVTSEDSSAHAASSMEETPEAVNSKSNENTTVADMKEPEPPESQMEQVKVETLQEGMKEEHLDVDLHQDRPMEEGGGEEKGKLIDQDKGKENKTGQKDLEFKKEATGLEENKEEEADGKIIAQSSEELLITKIEDLNETPMDMDQKESGKMEVDGPEYAASVVETQTDKDIKDAKNGITEQPAGMRTMPLLKRETKAQVAQHSGALPVRIKDEPTDEEYEHASELQASVGNVKDEPDTAAEFDRTSDELKISAVFSVGGNVTSVGPAAPAATPAKAPSVPTLPGLMAGNAIGVVCAGCKKILLKGQTAFQRKGSVKLYCSPQCLCSTSTVVVNVQNKKTCHYCQKEILDSKDVITVPGDASKTPKDFCSQTCLSSVTFKCSACQKISISHTHEVNLMGSIHKLCTDGCFNSFRSTNKLNISCCANCLKYCNSADGQCLTLQIEGTVMMFCNQNCLSAFKKKSLTPVTCKVCRTMHQAADMIESQNVEGIRELFCSTSCVTAHRVQTVSSSGTPVECNSCKLKLVPQYHLAMSDGTIRNFCSFSCVVTYQESFNKTKPNNQENTLTSTSVNVSVPKPAAPKTTPAETSSTAKGSTAKSTTSKGSTTKINNQSGQVPKIHCAQCLHLFFHKPELLEYKKKTYVFCDNACVEEFRRSNNIMARCEYCKIDKLVKQVKRINKIDRAFCSEGCKLLYKHDLVKRWGKKHCHSCLYCKSISQILVFGVIANKQEEFCGNDCLSKYTSLLNQAIKCTMCNQAKKMTESVKWQGEIKHFCSLRCLVFFCSLRCLTGTVNKAAAKPPLTQGTTQASSAVPQSKVNCTSLGPKEATPVIANVISLSSAPNGQPGVLGNPDLQGSVPASTFKVTGHASTQTDTVKAPAPPPRILKNKALLCKPLSQTKGTSCKPNVCTVTTQTDDSPSVIVLPVPVPVYVPVPMNLYTQYTPRPVGLPLPVPVPLFFPTTLDSAERIVKTIQEIKEKIPNDPLEAELIMMAEMVAEDTEKEKRITSNDETGSLMEGLDLEALSSNLNWEEDTLSSTQTWDQSSVLDRQPPSNSVTLTSASTPAEEPQMDLEADFPVESIEHMRRQTQEEQQTTDLVKQRSRRRGRDGLPQKKRGRKRAAAAEVLTSAPNSLLNLSKLHHEYGVNAWRDWVHWRNAQPNMETPRFGSRSMTLKEDLLQCSTAELSYGLCKFISEVRRPNGEKYSPDSIFYLCLGIQQQLFENDRMENIFADIFYSRFCQGITSILKEWKPTVLPSGYVHSRVEEEYLWECKQLGAFSPSVLLNTLLYFFTKFFNYRTVEQHRRLSFGHVIRCSRGQGTSKVACLRFYPPKEDTSTDGVPAKKRKEDDDDKEGMLELKENLENPLHCPVRLYEFYLSKCSPTVRQRTNLFYLSPERSCVPNSPMWFSSTSLSDEGLDSMLARILTVRELHLQPDESPSEVNSDSESN